MSDYMAHCRYPIARLFDFYNFRFPGKTMQGNILNAGEKFIAKIADDLHQYYMKEYKMSNYAGRLIKLMTIVNSLQVTDLK